MPPLDIRVAFLQVFEQYRCGQDPETPLRVAHDVGERLEVLLEMLPEIERAYVHLDWETDHRAEHQGTAGGLFSLPGADKKLSPRP